MKKCVKCLEIKETQQFNIGRNQCKSCRLKYKQSLPKKNHPVSVTEKSCTACQVVKPALDFHSNGDFTTGLYPYCKSCALVKQQEKYQRNKEKYVKKSTERYNKIKGTEAINAPARARQKRKLASNPIYKVTRNLRNRLYYAIKNTAWKKNSKFTKYIGCDRETLIKHLESQFVDGMSWDNYSNDTWHIDHIIPLASAGNEAELYKLCHYTNLQPMWALDNIKKADKI